MLFTRWCWLPLKNHFHFVQNFPLFCVRWKWAWPFRNWSSDSEIKWIVTVFPYFESDATNFKLIIPLFKGSMKSLHMILSAWYACVFQHIIDVEFLSNMHFTTRSSCGSFVVAEEINWLIINYSIKLKIQNRTAYRHP